MYILVKFKISKAMNIYFGIYYVSHEPIRYLFPKNKYPVGVAWEI